MEECVARDIRMCNMRSGMLVSTEVTCCVGIRWGFGGFAPVEKGTILGSRECKFIV